MRRATLIFLPGLLLIVAIALYLDHREHRNELQNIAERERLIADQQQELYVQTLSGIVADLHSLSQHNDFRKVLSSRNPEPVYRELAREYLAFMAGKGYYRRLSYIDTRGEERIVIANERGVIRSLDRSERLLVAANSDYRISSQLPAHGLYLSPLLHRQLDSDATIHLVRFGVAIIDERGKFHGALLLDYAVDHLFDLFDDIASFSSGQYSLLDGIGRMMHANANNMHRASHLSELHPHAWSTIAASDRGQFADDDGLFTHTALRPMTRLWHLKNGNGPSSSPNAITVFPGNYHWKLISLTSAATIERTLAAHRSQLAWVMFTILLLWGGVALLLARGIEERLRAQRELAARDARIRDIVETAQDGIITIDARGMIESFNPAACRIFGYDEHEAIGRSVNMIVPSPHREVHDDYLRRYIETLEGHIILKPRELIGVRKNGTHFPISLCVGAKQHEYGWRFTGIVRDISERKQMEAEMERMATHDGLTHLFNRGYFNDKIAYEFRRARRYRLPLSLILLDIDHFKSINDTYGHPAGDTLLQAVAHKIGTLSRETDIVARYGGEEFALILPQTPSADALVLAERLRAAIEQLQVFYEHHPIGRTTSVGVASFAPEIAEPATLIRQADEALYRAKREGRNRVARYDNENGE